MLVNIIQNTISSFISAGVAAAEVITTNLKMWLGFETSETLGTELVSNGDFSDGTTSGWTFQNLTADISNNTLKLTSTTSDNNRAYYNISTEVGKTYQMSVDVKSGATNSISGIGGISTTTPYNVKDGANAASFTTLKITFIATLTTTEIRLLNAKVDTWGGLGSIVEFDNVSVKELTQITPDKSGNNNVGELFTGKALDFDGAGDYVNISGFSMSGNNATFAFWAYIEENIKGDYFFDFHSTSTRFLLGFGQTSRELAIYSGGWHDFGDPPQDQWVRIVLTVNGTTAKCFVDGVQLGTDKTISTYDFSSATTAHIGARYLPEFNPKYYNGLLSDFQIYNSVWTTDDIAYDYANPNKLAIDNPSTNLVVTNLKAYWALSEGDGLVAYDSGTNLEEEEVVDGDFPTGTTAWTLQNGWSISEGVASINAISLYRRLSQSLNTTIGSTYVIKVNCNSYTSGYIYLRKPIQSGVADTDNRIESVGEFEFTLTITSDNDEIAFANGTLDTILSINNVSVREVTASDNGGLINGADYVDAQPRIPQLGMMNWSKGSNLLKYSEDFSQSIWIKNNLTQTYGFTSPTGLLNATKLIRTSTNSYIESTINITTVQYNTASIYVKGVTNTIGEDVRLYVYNGTSLSSQAFTLTGDWQKITHTNSSASGQSSMKIKLSIPNITNGEVLVWGGQLEQSSSASAYRLTDGAATLNSTVIANPTIPTQDIFGNAVRDRLNSFNLDGTGYAEVADDDDLDFGTGAFTMECWVKADFEFKGSSINVILSLGGSGSGSGSAALVAHSTNKLGGYVNGSTLDADSVFTIGDWYHVAITRNGSGLCTLYVDSVAQTDTETNQGNITNSDAKLIGRDTGTSRFYKNLISDVRLYDRALSVDEVENNYNAGLSAHTN